MTPEPERVALVGFMASGKSSVGPALAMRLGLAFVDLDSALEARAGRTIPEIFAQEGEEFFRRLESEVLADHLEGPPVVLGTGGGVVESPANRERLATEVRTVWLDARFDTIRRRLSSADAAGGRPLVTMLGWEGVRDLHRRRRPLYATCARWRFDTDRDAPVRLARRIAMALRARSA